MSHGKPITTKEAIDFSIVGDDILDIADFAIQKYEFRTGGTLSDEVREAASTAIRETLWERVEELKLKRKQILAGMFELADETMVRVVEDD